MQLKHGPYLPCGISSHLDLSLSAGGQDGYVKIFDLRTGSETASFEATDDTVNGFHFHPSLPLALLTSGMRIVLLPIPTSMFLLAIERELDVYGELLSSAVVIISC